MSTDRTVMLCTDYLPPSGGGVEVVVEKLACHLADRGTQVVLFSLAGADADLSPALDRPNVETVLADPLDLTGALGVQSRIAPGAPLAMWRALKRYDPDVVHVHNRFFFTTYLAGLAAALDDRPLVVTLHLGSMDAVGTATRYATSAIEHTAGRALLRRADAVISVSEAVDDIAARLGVESARRHVIYNGVDTDVFTPAASDGVEDILFVGRLVRNKGPHLFLGSLPPVLNDYPDATAHIVGTGPLEDELREMAATDDIADRVTFHGHVPDMAATMRRADVFCRPSLSEGMPLTVLEAMASGLPCVATPVAGVPEVIDHERTGLLVSPRTEEVTGALDRLLNDPEFAARLGSNGRQHVEENHSWSSRGDAVADLYDTIDR